MRKEPGAFAQDDVYPHLVRAGRVDGDDDTDLIVRGAADARYVRASQPVPGDLQVQGSIQWSGVHIVDRMVSPTDFAQLDGADTSLVKDGTSIRFASDASETTAFLVTPMELDAGEEIQDLICYVFDATPRDDTSSLVATR